MNDDTPVPTRGYDSATFRGDGDSAEQRLITNIGGAYFQTFVHAVTDGNLPPHVLVSAVLTGMAGLASHQDSVGRPLPLARTLRDLADRIDAGEFMHTKGNG